MIDLHLHLDGSLSPRLVLELAKEQGISLPSSDLEETARLLSVPNTCESLNEYLRCFEIPTQVLQSEEALFQAARELAVRLAGQGLWYGEIRFAPQLHTKRGMTQLQAVEAARKGLEEARKTVPKFSAQLILCCMRGGGDRENRETLETASHFLGNGVCAADLAGAEALYPTACYRELFSYARELGVPFTIHAGEAAGPESVWEALSFGASRIGHGVRALEDEDLTAELARRQIPLELCFTSNLQTKAISGPKDFPLREYLRRSVRATVNTDNMTVSRTTLPEEYQKLGLTEVEKSVLLANAIEAAFLPEADKERLRKRLEESRQK